MWRAHLVRSYFVCRREEDIMRAGGVVVFEC
jgi:hypothetical protein